MSEVVAFTATQIPGIAESCLSAGARRAAVSEGHPGQARGRARGADRRARGRRGRVRVFGRLPPAGDARGVAIARRRSATSNCLAHARRCLRAASRSWRSARYGRGAARARPPQGGTSAARCRAGGRVDPPPDALSRPGGDPRAALCKHRRHRRSNPTIEEREEYEPAVQAGLVMYAGVDYAAILEQAQAEADVIVWDGGNNDFSFIAPDLLDRGRRSAAGRPGLGYFPGETNLLMADVVSSTRSTAHRPSSCVSC